MKIEDMSFEEFIIFKITLNAGSQGGIEAPTRKEVDEFCISKGIEIERGDSKRSLVEKALERGITYEELKEYFKEYLGIHSIGFQNKFGVDHKTIKQLEKKNLLKVMYYATVRMYGKYCNVPMYDASVYFGSVEDFNKLLECMNC